MIAPRTCYTVQVIIADESHYLKNEKAKRTKNCVPLLQVSEGKIENQVCFAMPGQIIRDVRWLI